MFAEAEPGSVSKLVGQKAFLKIPMADIAVLRKKRTAKMFPNAIKIICMDESKWIFTSLMFRDQVFEQLQVPPELLLPSFLRHELLSACASALVPL